jgi:hypothetical protein
MEWLRHFFLAFYNLLFSEPDNPVLPEEEPHPGDYPPQSIRYRRYEFPLYSTEYGSFRALQPEEPSDDRIPPAFDRKEHNDQRKTGSAREFVVE